MFTITAEDDANGAASLQAPLLAADESPPSLGNGETSSTLDSGGVGTSCGVVAVGDDGTEDNNNSRLAQLMKKEPTDEGWPILDHIHDGFTSSTTPRAGTGGGTARRGRPSSSTTTRRDTGDANDENNDDVRSSPTYVISPSSSFTTVVLGALVLLQGVLLWASYWNCDYWFALEVKWDFVSLMSDPHSISWNPLDLIHLAHWMLHETHKYFLFIALVITILILPCASLILNPLVILGHYKRATTLTASSSASSTDPSQVDDLVGQTRLRIFQWDHLLIRSSFFWIFWLVVTDASIGSNLSFLWTSAHVEVHSEFESGSTCFALAITCALAIVCILRYKELDDVMLKPRNSCYLPWLSLQLALLSCLSLLASCFFPLWTMTFDGIATQLMNLKEPVSIFWSHLPSLLVWSNGHDTFARYALFLIYATQIWIIPLVLWTIICLWWCGSSRDKSTTRWILSMHPLSNGITAAVALVWCVRSFQSVFESLLKDVAGTVCEQVQDSSGVVCLEMVGSLGVGGWLFVIHAISLELFVLVTILASRMKRR